jgi:hypothetical protein
MPFKVDAIRVEGGSEFMAQFEDACTGEPSSSSYCRPKAPRSTGDGDTKEAIRDGDSK